MKAAVLEAVGKISLRDLPEPERLGAESVLVEVGAVGVCGSDVLRYGVGKGYGFPLVLGHEMSGILLEDAPAAGLRLGDKVAIFPCLPRPEDPYTHSGDWALSEGYDYFGSRRNGGLQARLQVPQQNLVKLPQALPLVLGAMVEPAGVSLHAVRKAVVPANCSTLVIGGGPIGNLAAQWLRYLGSSRTVVADIDEKKLEIAREVSLDTIQVSGTVGSDWCSNSLNPRGFDIVVEATGLPASVINAIEAAAPKGQIVLLGDLSSDLELKKELVSTILRKELTLYGTWNAKIRPSYSNEWEMVVNAIGSGLHLQPLVSHVFALEESDQVFRDLYSRKYWYNKVSFAVSDTAIEEARQHFEPQSSAGLRS